jgi:hypothetical protein
MSARRSKPAYIYTRIGGLEFRVSWHPKLSGPHAEPRQPGLADAFATAHALARAGEIGDRDATVRLTDEIRDRDDMAEAAGTLGALAFIAGEIARSVSPEARAAMWERVAAAVAAVDNHPSDDQT